MKCLNCGKELEGRHQKKFCGSSCSAIYNNKKYPKRKPNKTGEYKVYSSKGRKNDQRRVYIKHHCIDCGGPLTREALRCAACNQKYTFERTSNKTLGEVINAGSPNAYFARVRKHARVFVEDFLKWEKKCGKCGYDKYVEVCHIKPLRDFDESATLAEANAPENLMLLCPNCHWEFDHGLI